MNAVANVAARLAEVAHRYAWLAQQQRKKIGQTRRGSSRSFGSTSSSPFSKAATVAISQMTMPSAMTKRTV
jgi:hypothetical protein